MSIFIAVTGLLACSPRTGDAVQSRDEVTPRAGAGLREGDAPLEFRYDHYAMLVPNLDSASDWLQEVFGVREVYDGTEKDHIRWFTFGDGQTLHVIEGEEENRFVPKPVHVALRTADLDAFVEHLVSLEIPYQDWVGAAASVSTRPDEVRQIYVEAPGGYWFEINDSPVVEGVGRLVGAPK